MNYTNRTFPSSAALQTFLKEIMFFHNEFIVTNVKHQKWQKERTPHELVVCVSFVSVYSTSSEDTLCLCLRTQIQDAADYLFSPPVN